MGQLLLQRREAVLLYQTAKEAVSRTSEVREDKVAQIKAAMEAGTYRVSAQEVAGKMLENIATLTF